jgi:hypothetical protein
MHLVGRDGDGDDAGDDHHVTDVCIRCNLSSVRSGEVSCSLCH